MRIVLLSRATYPYHPYGGMERAVYGTACGLAELGHTVELFTASPLPGWEERAKEVANWPPPFNVHFLPYRLFRLSRPNSIPDRLANYPLFALRLGWRLAQIQPEPDIIYCQGLSGLGWAMRGHAPLIVNPQGMEELKVREWAKRAAYAPFNQLLRFTAKRAAAVIATDSPQILEVQQLLGVAASKVVMIPNAVDLPRLNPSQATLIARLRQRYLGENGFLLISVGRLETNKGLNIGLAALALAGPALPSNWHWVIVGQGSQRTKLEGEAARLGLLGKHVSFVGSLPDHELQALYQAADLFLHPTLYEGSSLVTLEAMAHSLPIVASAAGGLPDKIREIGPDANGRLCPPGNSKALAQAIRQLAAFSPEQRAAMGAASRARVEQDYTWPQVAFRLSQLFEQLKKVTDYSGGAGELP